MELEIITKRKEKKRKEVKYAIKFLCYFINFDCKVNSCCKNYQGG